MNVQTLAPEEAIEAVQAEDNIDTLRGVASDLNLKFSGNTGADTLKKKILDHMAAQKTETTDEGESEDTMDFGGHDEEIQIAQAPVRKGPTITELLKMDPTTVEDPQLRRQVIRAQSLKLSRVRITNLDPSDSPLSGAIISVTSKYTGKVSKYIPFGEESENGYHVPQILLDHIRDQKFAMRKEVKGNRFGVKQYRTSLVNKFSVEVLPPLTPQELSELAAHQRASHAIDG